MLVCLPSFQSGAEFLLYLLHTYLVIMLNSMMSARWLSKYEQATTQTTPPLLAHVSEFSQGPARSPLTWKLTGFVYMLVQRVLETRGDGMNMLLHFLRPNPAKNSFTDGLGRDWSGIHGQVVRSFQYLLGVFQIIYYSHFCPIGSTNQSTAASANWATLVCHFR